MGNAGAMVMTPELDKMSKVKKESQVIGEFIDWITSEKKTTFCLVDKKSGRFVPACFNTEKLLAEFFGINLNKAEGERVALLRSLHRSSAIHIASMK